MEALKEIIMDFLNPVFKGVFLKYLPESNHK